MNTATHPARPRTRTRTVAALGALLVAGALGLAGCGGASSANDDAVRSDGSVDLAKVTLVVGDQKGTSAEQMLSAAGLDDTPYKIEYKEFTSGPPILEALNAGAIDVGGVGNTPPIFAAAAKSRFKAVQAVSYTGAGDSIVVPKGSPITSVGDLKGKTVAVAQGSSANYNLLAQLQKAGLKYSDITVQNLQPADALAAFTSGHVDAWAIWDPFTAQVQTDDGASILASGDGVTNGLSFEVASDKAIDDQATRAALSDYLGRITQAQVWSSEHRDEWTQIWAKQTGLSTDITQVAAARRPVTIVPVGPAVLASEQKMADTFTDNGLIPGKVDLADYFDDEFSGALQKGAGSAYDASWSDEAGA